MSINIDTCMYVHMYDVYVHKYVPVCISVYVERGIDYHHNVELCYRYLTL